MNFFTRQNTLLLCIFLFSTGCVYQPAQHTTDQLVPQNYGGIITDQSVRFVRQIEQDWWKAFGMPELDEMLIELEKANYDLEIARQRILRSQVLLGQQKSKNRPTIDATLAGTRTTTEIGSEKVTEEGHLAFNAAYEVDLWGDRAAANHAAELDIVLEHAQFRSAALTLQARLARQYFEYLSLQDRIDTTVKNLKATKELLSLVKLRFNAGRASRIELNQQQNILLTQRARLSILERDRDLAEHAMAVLLGRNKLLTVSIKSSLGDANIPMVDLIQPASLLQTRPDILVAETKLKISDALVYQNRTKQWPSLRLTADSTLNDIIRADQFWTTSLIGQLAAPLFNAGRIKSEIEAAKIDATISLKQYELTVIKALQEVLNTLADLYHQHDIYSVRKDEVETTKHLYNLARKRFEAGNIDFINLLDAQRTWFSAAERVAVAKTDYLAATINTFKAMGVPPILLEASPLDTHLTSANDYSK